MIGVLQRNIEALAAMRRRLDERKNVGTRVADAITAFTGSMTFVVLHALLVAGWILVNTGLLPILRPFDPFPFVMLAMIASVEAIFLSTFVLISQNRMAALSGQRAELDVQISLLAEHELTKLIAMVEALMKHQGVPIPVADEIAELKQDVKPERVVERIDDTEEA